MDIMGVVSSAIQGITKSYGKKVAKKTTAPAIADVLPQTIKGETYRLGFATDEIMPQDFPNSIYWIAGHGSGHRMEGIISPVYISAVWLDCGNDEGMLWLTADIVGLTNIEVAKVRSMIMASNVIKGCKLINFSCTHSHSGIDTLGYWGKPFASIPSDGKDKDYMEQLFNKAVKVSEEAFLNRQAGKLFAGRKAIPGGLDAGRLFADKHEYLSRIRFAPENGENETWLINIGAHPNSLGGSNRKLSGEYPYFMREIIKNQTGANVHFGIGAIGGMDAPDFDKEDKLNCIKMQAEYFAENAMAVEEERELTPEIKYIQQPFYLPVDNNVLCLLAMKGTMSFKAYPHYDSLLGIAMKTEITYMTFGDQKFLLLPGENFVNTVYGSYHSAEESTTGKGPEINPTPLAEICEDSTMVAYGVSNDMSGYVVPPNDFILNETQPFLNGGKDRFDRNHYHETNSMGINTQKYIADTFTKVVKNFNA